MTVRAGRETLSFRDELENLINKHGQEDKSNTPDSILAGFLKGCLDTFDEATIRRTRWYESGRGKDDAS